MKTTVSTVQKMKDNGEKITMPHSIRLFYRKIVSMKLESTQC